MSDHTEQGIKQAVAAEMADMAQEVESLTYAEVWGFDQEAARPLIAGADDERLVMACDWSDFRKDYGVSPDPEVSTREHRAFKAGWKAGRHGDQSGVLR